MPFFDFHTHSHFSDGEHSPQHLAKIALEAGIKQLALTDHDCVDGLPELKSNALGLEVINGVEISSTWQNTEIHILGLLIDPGHKAISELLENQQHLRRERIERIRHKLCKLGISGLLEYLENLNCKALTRTHVSNFLVSEGHSKNNQKAFKVFLGKKGKVYSPANWCDLTESVNAIAASGGIAVIAHPSRYSISSRALNALVKDFRNAGGEGLEISYPNIDQATRKNLKTLAIKNNLYCSGGSDFHSYSRTWAQIGKFPTLQDNGEIKTIFEHPSWKARQNLHS